MLSLAELQERIASAVMTGDVERAAPELLGGADPRQRLRIHWRSYETSLSTALCERYSATAWLAGSDLIAAAARAYLRAHPPRRPCIAEYGEEFPEFLSSYGRATDLPYLRSFAALERAVAAVSLAIDEPPLAWGDVVRTAPERLLDLSLTLQSGVRYAHSRWSVDELMTMYLADSAPAAFALPEVDAFIEVRGARGAVWITRLDPAAFSFRKALLSGQSIGAAAEDALELDDTFDAGFALRQLTQIGLATGLLNAPEGVSS